MYFKSRKLLTLTLALICYSYDYSYSYSPRLKSRALGTKLHFGEIGMLFLLGKFG